MRFLFGVKRSEKYDSISIILDEDSVDDIWKIILKIEEHLKKPLSKILYERDNGTEGHTTTIYPKIRDWYIFYDENENEIDPMVYERKNCKVKAVLEIEGILLKEDGNASLQIRRVYEAKVCKRRYEHVRILDMEW